MRTLVALLAAVLAAPALAACGGDGAEPGARERATLVLDFQPNAVHAGIYTALARGLYESEGVELEVREPSASTDGPKLLAAGRAELAILDIHDLGIARQRGLDVVGVMPIVQRPLAAVIAGDRAAIRRPRDLEGRAVGVTGLPSDDAVLDAVLEADGADPAAVRRVTIGFEAVGSLAAGSVDAATAFWNAEGVALRSRGVPTREFRVDAYGAPRYPELVLATSADLLEESPGIVDSTRRATAAGYRAAVRDPQRALERLLDGAPGLDRAQQSDQLAALMRARAFEPVGRFDAGELVAWSRWDVEHGILERLSLPQLARAFPLERERLLESARGR